MTTTDIIATGALIVSTCSLIYTYYSSYNNKEREFLFFFMNKNSSLLFNYSNFNDN